MEYPRTITIENEELQALLESKEDLIITGREKSEEIDAKDAEMKEIDKSIQEVEKTVDIVDLNTEAQAITDEMNAVMVKMEDLKKRLHARISAGVPKELIESYEAVAAQKEELELERNKIGLKVQQFTDQIIPLAQGLMKEHIQNEWEDYDSIRMENGKIVAVIFSHLETLREALNKKKQA
jgi:predicted  nucleic acid-binding Zn-ribbon protein